MRMMLIIKMMDGITAMIMIVIITAMMIIVIITAMIMTMMTLD